MRLYRCSKTWSGKESEQQHMACSRRAQEQYFRAITARQEEQLPCQKQCSKKQTSDLSALPHSMLDKPINLLFRWEKKPAPLTVPVGCPLFPCCSLLLLPSGRSSASTRLAMGTDNRACELVAGCSCSEEIMEFRQLRESLRQKLSVYQACHGH